MSSVNCCLVSICLWYLVMRRVYFPAVTILTIQLFRFQIQKLRQELAAAQFEIVSLSSHLNTNVITNYISAYLISLSSCVFLTVTLK